MPIDASGEIDGQTFSGVPEMAHLIADIPTARSCYVAEWLRFAEGKLNSDADQAYIDWLMSGFSRNTPIADLVITMVGSDTFRYLAPAAGAP